MSKFQLDKAIEKTKFVLAKNNVNPAIKAQVALNLDVSGSTRGMYDNGSIQEAFQRILPMGIIFDDNQEIDVFTFANNEKIRHLDVNATAQNYSDYIKKQILNNPDVDKWGGTDYAPVLMQNLEAFGFYRGFFSKKLGPNSASGFPVVVYMITDGQNNDPKDTLSILQEAQDAKSNIYFMFIGVGNEKFEFLTKIADKFDNTGFLNVKDINSFVDDEKIIDLLLPLELLNWLKK